MKQKPYEGKNGIKQKPMKGREKRHETKAEKEGKNSMKQKPKMTEGKNGMKHNPWIQKKP